MKMENKNFKRKFFIRGQAKTVMLTEILIDDILFDAANPRIGLQADMATQKMDQEEIAFFLERKNIVGFQKLKDSIRENKGIVNPVWIVKDGEKYKILEGNTRLLIFFQLRDSEKQGKKYYSKIKAYVIKEKINEEDADFIRLTAHLRGTTDWDAYEKSRYLTILTGKGFSRNKLEKLTKLRRSDIDNSIDAFKLMSEQFLPRYGKDLSDVFKFSYFVEYVKDKKLKDIMERNKLGDKNFCSWVGSGKLKRARDVRDLRNILSNDHTKDVFIKKGYNSAIDRLSVINPSAIRGIYNDIENIIDDLGNKISPEDMVEMKEDKKDERRKLLLQLKAKLEDVLELIE